MFATSIVEFEDKMVQVPGRAMVLWLEASSKGLKGNLNNLELYKLSILQ